MTAGVGTWPTSPELKPHPTHLTGAPSLNSASLPLSPSSPWACRGVRQPLLLSCCLVSSGFPRLTGSSRSADRSVARGSRATRAGSRNRGGRGGLQAPGGVARAWRGRGRRWLPARRARASWVPDSAARFRSGLQTCGGFMGPLSQSSSLEKLSSNVEVSVSRFVENTGSHSRVRPSRVGREALYFRVSVK